MKKLYIVTIGLVLSTSCKNSKTAKDLEIVTVKENEIQVVVQKILDLPKLQGMFHLKVANRLPLKLVANEFINEEVKLQKFDSVVLIAKLSSFKKENIQDYLVFDDLSFKKDTAYFNLKYPIEGVQVKGKLIKTKDAWTVHNHVLVENKIPESKPLATSQPPQEISIFTLPYKGANLGYLATKYYGNSAYRNVLSAYNDFKDKRSIDKEHDSIKIPKLSGLSNDPAFPKLNLISDELKKIVDARKLYIEQELTFWNLPRATENRDFRQVPQAQKLKILTAAKRMYEAIAEFEQQENPPKKAIGQFRQVAENLENIAQGKIDENGYALDMVHQRMAHGLANCIKWAKEDN